jgi:hypothetical protein
VATSIVCQGYLVEGYYDKKDITVRRMRRLILLSSISHKKGIMIRYYGKKVRRIKKSIK